MTEILYIWILESRIHWNHVKHDVTVLTFSRRDAYGHRQDFSVICGHWPRELLVGDLERWFAAAGRMLILVGSGEGVGKMNSSLCTYVCTWVLGVLFNHRTWMVCDLHFVRIPVESNEITSTMTSQYWSFHVEPTVIQYFSKAVTYSERYSICTVRYTIFNPQRSKTIASCTFLLQNLYRVFFYSSWYVST